MGENKSEGFKEIKEDLNSLKADLNETSSKKEEAFKQKESLKKEIFRLINKIKNLKKSSDNVNIDFKDIRGERDSYNEKVKELSLKLKTLNNTKKEIIKKNKIKGNPIKIKQQIDKLERDIEINAYPYEKEQKIMGQIKKLKKVYSGYSLLIPIIDEISSVDKELNETKGKARNTHKRLRDAYKDNKLLYKNFIGVSKQINNLKKRQEESFMNYTKYRNEFNKINTEIKQKLIESRALRDKVDKQNLRFKNLELLKKRRVDDEIIAEKIKGVEEKIKRGEKLTNEDLLVYQRKDE